MVLKGNPVISNAASLARQEKSMSEADLFSTARVRINGKCAIVSLSPVSPEPPRPLPFPQTPNCEWTRQPYQPWCRTHQRYHRDHHEPWTQACQL
jgi:hypothetical protein